MERESLLQAVIESPDDNAVRLVYADWLQEHGQGTDHDRAQFIRLQVQAEQQPAHSRRRCELKWEAERLLGRHRREWLSVLPWWADDFGGSFFQRGFVNEMYVRSNHFVEEFPELPRREPVMELCLNSSPDKVPVKKVLALPGLERLRGLNFSCHNIDNKGAAALAEFPGFRNLKRLTLSTNKIGPAGATALLSSTHFERLEYLDLSGNKIGPKGLKALVAGRLPALREIALSRGQTGAGGLRRLLTSELGKRLTALCLSGSFAGNVDPTAAERLAAAGGTSLTRLSLIWAKIGDSGLTTLARAAHLGRLRDLRLHGCNCGAEGVRALAGRPLPDLEKLAVPYGEMGDDGVSALAEARHWPELRSLSLHHQPFTAAGMAALARAEWPLGELDLSWCSLDDQAIRTLAASPLLTNVHTLNLERNQVGPAGARALAVSPYASGLIDLNLSHNSIDPEGMIALAQSETLTSLRRLDLEFNPIGDRGVEALAGSALLQRLVNLNLSCTEITARGAKTLADRLDHQVFGEVRLLGCRLGLPLAMELGKRFGGRRVQAN
jgi:uncharacterized protein (TIGR02996 family)